MPVINFSNNEWRFISTALGIARAAWKVDAMATKDISPSLSEEFQGYVKKSEEIERTIEFATS